MQQRITLTHRMFYGGLLLMLGTGIVSATLWPAGGPALLMLTAAGAAIALSARLWQRHLRRTLRMRNAFADLGGYPLNLLQR